MDTVRHQSQVRLCVATVYFLQGNCLAGGDLLWKQGLVSHKAYQQLSLQPGEFLSEIMLLVSKEYFPFMVTATKLGKKKKTQQTTWVKPWDQMPASREPFSTFFTLLTPSSKELSLSTTYPKACQVALQLLIQQKVDGKRVTCPVWEYSVDDVAVLVAKLLSHMEQHALAEVINVNPAERDRQSTLFIPSSQWESTSTRHAYVCALLQSLKQTQPRWEMENSSLVDMAKHLSLS